MTDLIIIGSGGHAKSVIDAVEAWNKYHIIGLVDDYLEAGTKKHGYEIIGNVDCVKHYLSRCKSKPKIHVAVGDNKARKSIVDRLNMEASDFATIIHPTAYISKNVRHIGVGCFFGAFANVNTGCEIGMFSIVNTKASCDHDCHLSTYTFLAPNATLAGDVYVGTYTHIGIGVSVNQKLHIGANTIIGTGSVVVKNIPTKVIAYGVPCRTIRENNKT